MWLPILLAVATLVLLQCPQREMFETDKDPSSLSEEDLSALMDTPEGKVLRAESISKFRKDSIPDASIPEYVRINIKKVLTAGWEIKSSLTDQTQLESRLRSQFLSDQAIERAGKSFADAAFNFAKMYYTPVKTACEEEKAEDSTAALASMELTKAAGQPVPVSLSPLSVVLQGIKDEDVRTMLKNYSTLMVSYKTTGQSSYKAAADLSLDALKKHIRELDAKAEADAKKVTKFVDTYETNNKDINNLRSQLRSIRKQGPKLEDQYETQKKINESIPETKKNYWLKVGLIAGLAVIAYLASNYIGENAPISPKMNYALKGGLVVGLVSIGFVAYRFLLG